VKILHLINTLSAGGAELHLLALCRYLKKQGIDVTVACLRENVRGSRPLRADFEAENIPVISLAGESRYSVGFLGRLLTLVRRARPDILHTHLPRADIAGALAARARGARPLICSVHGIYRDRWFGSWAAPVMRWAYGEADAVIAISAAVEDWLARDLGARAGNIRVIHYGIETARFTTPLECKSGLRGDSIVIGSMGRLEPGKGFDCLIRAMQIVRAQVPNAILRIAGPDPHGYGETLRRLIAELNLEAAVQWVGFQADAPAFFRGLDVFAFASHSEGFGQVVIEAMAAGKPVIASRIAPLTEIVVERENGFLEERGNADMFAGAIQRLCCDAAERRRLGERGKKRVEEYFTVDRMGRETVSLYEQLLGQSRSLKSVA
jgi:glycosyltransferase involved in cell wall biosynthesis